MSEILLVTCGALPDGEPRGWLLVDALAQRGVTARWVAWDDPDVDWVAADLVAVRSTWDYDSRLPEFLAWARRVEAEGATVLNGSRVFEWNTDKAYIRELDRAGVSVVPTVVVEGEEGLPAAIAEFGRAVVKPRTGAGGRGVVVFDLEEGGPEGIDESALQIGPWLVQPLVESIHTEGEWSVYVLDGKVVSAARKMPARGDIRVHEEYGGHTVVAEVTAGHGTLALAAVRAAEELLGCRLPYARVDQMRLPDGSLAVSELELTEPGLYLDHLPGNAAVFADMVVAQLPAS
ncbi:ATP-grasp domain-containing protein [Nocardioides alcanivorans]|uniref:ATP-grasp domain-containing protein n=1 Tax=Nocardioides alcanivorans TaxID=2897352 RepID=UPI001F3573C7|nr:hypothetical protein [Nocardioides alcanivorans]